MGVRFTAASGQYLSRTANLPAIGAYTLMAWCRPASLPAFAAVLGIGSVSGGTPNNFIGRTNSDWGIWVQGVANPFASAAYSVAAGDVECVALTCNGTDVIGYTRKRAANAWTIVTATAQTGTVDAVRVGNSTYDGTDYWDGRIWNVKVWDRALSAEELLVESFFDRVKFPQSLNFHWPLRSADSYPDLSGNGRTPALTGTPTTEDSAFKPWGPAGILVPSVSIPAVPRGPSVKVRVGSTWAMRDPAVRSGSAWARRTARHWGGSNWS